jgi:hypothetical protein
MALKNENLQRGVGVVVNDVLAGLKREGFHVAMDQHSAMSMSFPSLSRPGLARMPWPTIQSRWSDTKRPGLRDGRYAHDVAYAGLTTQLAIA